MNKNNLFASMIAATLAIGGPQTARADIQSAAAFHPGLRFRVQNENLDILAHWANPVSAQFISIVDQSVQQHVLTEILQLSNAAQVDLRLIGFPDAMFSNAKAVPNDTQIIVMAYAQESEPHLLSATTDGLGETLDIGRANGDIGWILEMGLTESDHGCLGRWKVSQENELEGFVLALSSMLSMDDKKSCISNYLPTAFGIASTANLYDLSAVAAGETQETPAPPFLNRSEPLFSLRAAATCRNQLNDKSAGCPFRLIESIIRHHYWVMQDIRN
jgi:hypothetical protein